MRTISTVFAAALAAFSLLPTANAAQESFPNLTNGTKMIDSVVAEDLAQTVREIGGGDVQIREANGKKGITFWDGENPYTMVPVFCDIQPGKCLGYVMVIVVDNTQLKFTLDTLNAANKSTSFLTFFQEEQGKFTVGRVNIIDGGVTKKNVAVNISVCAMEFREALKRLENQLTAGLSPQFQRVGNGPVRVRAFAPSPDYVARIAAAMEKDYARRFGRR